MLQTRLSLIKNKISYLFSTSSILFYKSSYI